MTYVVTVDWVVHPQHAHQFAKLASAQAQNSINLEDDCLFFDLCRSDVDGTHFFMYEIYTDRAAFDLHLDSDHFHTFSRKVADMVVSKEIKTFEKV